MNRGLISALLIPVFLLYTLFAGCFEPPKTTVKILPDEPIPVSEKIVGLVTRDGKKITFDDRGGSYTGSFLITGETVDGQKVSLTSGTVTEFRLTIPDAVSWDSLKGRRVTEVVTRDGHLMKFDGKGGHLNLASMVIVGADSAGEVDSFARERLREIRITRARTATLQQVVTDSTLKVVELVTNSGLLYTLNPNACTIQNRANTIDGISVSPHRYVQIPLDEILYLQVERVDPTGRAITTFLSVIVVAAMVAGLLLLIIALTKESCPFVYSFDGANFVLDAEPLGGATTRSLLRTDYSKLKHLRPVDNTYRLLVRNEFDETQYLDRMSLLQVDHDSAVQIVADEWGTFHGVRSPSPAFAATDERGTSILPFVCRQDSIFWQTSMESELQRPDRPIRQTLTFSFLKPHTAKRASLVVHGGTTLWGSNMIREMYRLYGTSMDGYHKALDEKRPEFYRMLQFMEREELYQMKLYVKNDTGWSQRGTIRGGGPFVYETQIIPLSVRHTASDTLTIQVHPPAGFWSIDYVGMQYDVDETFEGKEIQPSKAVNQNGENILPTLLSEDGTMTVMPTLKDKFTLEFPAPVEPARQARTLFLKTTGYYVLNFHPDTPPASKILEHIGSTPGAIVEYSYQLFEQWKSSMANR